MTEIWLPVNGFEDRYYISNFGRFKVLEREVNNRGKIKLRKEVIHFGHKNGAGYRSFSVRLDGRTKVLQLHRLVAEHFVNNDKSLPVVNHKDGNKENNFYKNLEWSTVKHNVQHSYDIGLASGPKGESNGKSKLKENEVMFIIKNKKVISQRKMAEKFGVSKACINSIHNGKNWKHINR